MEHEYDLAAPADHTKRTQYTNYKKHMACVGSPETSNKRLSLLFFQS
jgi:hypothetical protein